MFCAHTESTYAKHVSNSVVIFLFILNDVFLCGLPVFLQLARSVLTHGVLYALLCLLLLLHGGVKHLLGVLLAHLFLLLLLLLLLVLVLFFLFLALVLALVLLLLLLLLVLVLLVLFLLARAERKVVAGLVAR